MSGFSTFMTLSDAQRPLGYCLTNPLGKPLFARRNTLILAVHGEDRIEVSTSPELSINTLFQGLVQQGRRLDLFDIGRQEAEGLSVASSTTSGIPLLWLNPLRLEENMLIAQELLARGVMNKGLMNAIYEALSEPSSRKSNLLCTCGVGQISYMHHVMNFLQECGAYSGPHLFWFIGTLDLRCPHPKELADIEQHLGEWGAHRGCEIWCVAQLLIFDTHTQNKAFALQLRNRYGDNVTDRAIKTIMHQCK